MRWSCCPVVIRDPSLGRPGRLILIAGLALAGATVCSTTAANSVFSGSLLLTSKPAGKKPAAPPRAQASVAPLLAARAKSPVVTVSGTAPGQEGFIHYFVITGPDGEPESHVGIELADNQIAWSFPELGVVAVPFIPKGSITANGKEYAIEHLYGIKPFPDEPSMRALQKALPARLAAWTTEKTPYCDEQANTLRFCVSCLGFVLRVLYPGPSLFFTALPADFKSARKNIYTTEDLLLYLTGVPVDAPRAAQLKRIEALAVPNDMREELVRIASETEVAQPVTTAATSKPNAANGPRTGSRRAVDLPKRVLVRRRS